MSVDQELRGVIGKIEEWFGRDIDRFLDCFETPVAVIGARGTVVLADRAQTRSMFEPLFASLAARQFEETVADTVEARVLWEDLALVDAAFTRRRGDGSVLERVGALYVCRRVGGAWRIAALIPHPPESRALSREPEHRQ